MKSGILIIMTAFVVLGNWFPEKGGKTTQLSASDFKEKLSEYAFFKGNIADHIPEAGVVPYTLNSPLFSDHAHKLRFVQVPDNQVVNYNSEKALDFPVGSSIIKTFFYYADERKPEKGRRLIETRLLIRDSDGWYALPYIWNDAQTDAFLEFPGGSTAVTWRDANGNKQHFEYTIPNANQCKGCHAQDNVVMPIGPSARQLNGDFKYAEGVENQLVHWQRMKILEGLPTAISDVPKLDNYTDTRLSLDRRARAYLEINCAHCHNRKGAAQTSGLFLYAHEKDSLAYGFLKTPVAAGKGSGGLKYDIVAGKPKESILLYRMQSLDPGEMMPELSRSLIHKDGVELIRNWIQKMK
jgi:uncharacterized repeat protein (TIGR03806 family)